MFLRQRGVAMVKVIALLAVLAVFGVAIVLVATTQHVGAALDLQGVRAYHAARGGLEWGLFQVLRNGQTCAAIDGQTVVYGDNLAGFSATLQCASSPHPEGAAAVTMFALTSTGCNEGTCPTGATPSAMYVERQLRVTVGSN